MDYNKIHLITTNFIKERVEKQAIIGLSGGIDSALTCSLAVDALGKENVKVLIIKNVRYSDENLAIARGFAEEIGIERIEINSNGIRDEFLSKIDIDKTNVRRVSTLDARITDLIIRTVAGEEDRIYLGTINGTERITGWYPKGSLFGDFCPISGLLKHQVQYLARYQKLPEGIIDSVSGDASRVCSGCGDLPEFHGIPYDALDAVLYIYETEKPQNRHREVTKLGISDTDYRIIMDRIEVANNKSDVFCPYPKINMQNTHLGDFLGMTFK